MKAQLGRPTGLALALLSTLLATFLAMGVFTVAQADEHSATRSFSATTVAPGAEITVSIALSEYGEGGSIAETLPEGFGFVSGSIQFVGGGGFARPSGNMVNVVLAGAGITNVTYKVTAPSAAGGPHEFSGNFVDFVGDSEAIGGDSMVTVAADGGNGESTDEGGSIELSSQVAGDAVKVDLTVWAHNPITAADTITVDLKKTGGSFKFGVPTRIDPEDIIIQDPGGGTGDYDGPPRTVTVSGTNIIMTLHSRIGNTATDAGRLTGKYSITLTQSAGITNPTSAGAAEVTVKDEDPDDHKLAINIESKVKLSKASGPRGTDLTVSGVGFATGDATVTAKGPADSDTAVTVGRGSVSGGMVSVVVDTSSSDFKAGKNTINIVGPDGSPADNTAEFEIKPTISVPQDSVQQGDKVTIVVKDWNLGPVDRVTIGGIPAPNPSLVDPKTTGGEVSFEIPTTAKLGQQEIKVHSGENSAKGTIIIGALSLTADPDTLVLGQQFTIRVSGLTTESPTQADAAQIVELVIDAYKPTASTGGTPIAKLTIDTNGNFSDTFTIDPNKTTGQLTPGTYRVRVKDHKGRVAVGKITIPKPSISLNPEVSQRGSNVVLTGENFPAHKVVNIRYQIGGSPRLLGAVLADGAGRVRTTFPVPADAPIGQDQDVVAESDIKATSYRAKAKHSLPPQDLTVTPDEVSSGGRITIEGHNMPLFTLIRVEIGNITVSSRGLATDGTGSFVIEDVLVPQLQAGTHTVAAFVRQTGGTEAEVRKNIRIADVVTRDSAKAFESLIDNGTLTRVWHLDRQTQTWSFFDPAPEFADFNTLSQVSSGQIVTIIMNAQDTFQGQTLFTGSNPIAIE